MNKLNTDYIERHYGQAQHNLSKIQPDHKNYESHSETGSPQ